MKYYLGCITLFTAIVSISGCGKGFRDDSYQSDKSSNYSISINEEDEIGKYTVTISSKNDQPYSVVKHNILDKTISELATNVSGTIVDGEVISGHIYRYEIGFFDHAKSLNILHDEEVKIPLDFNSATKSLILQPGHYSKTSKDGTKFIQINRMDIGNNVTLSTFGENFIIEVNRLYGNGGSIETFREEQKADDGKNGRHGGTIRIEAKYAVGKIDIHLRGESGGDGIRPEPLGEIGKGKTGSKGSLGESSRSIFVPSQGDPQTTSEECIKEPGPGGVGEKGLPGTQGSDGRRGGGTGSIYIDIEETKNFEVDVHFLPGKGGKGSAGQLGGPGGDGGESGDEILYITREHEDSGTSSKTYTAHLAQICSNRTFGLTGPQGDEGSPGADGNEGESGQYCIRKNDEKNFTCKQREN